MTFCKLYQKECMGRFCSVTPEPKKCDHLTEEKPEDNCRPEIKAAISEEDRKTAANKLGPNWANIMSGLGDQ